jgi:2-oxoglutarate dehydrogenase E2 component (dihydrolipoamide succinyltransferase)
MAIEIRVPAVGESVTEGTLARWFKKDGDTVQAEEPLVELETDKATAEVAAPASGVLRIRVPEGQTVSVGTILGQIEERAGPAPRSDDKPRKPAEAKSPPGPAPKEPVRTLPHDAAPTRQPVPPAPLAVSISPSARRLADKEGVDIRQLTGTGPRGRVTKEDVLNYLDRSRGQQRPRRNRKRLQGHPQLPPRPLPLGRTANAANA